MSGRAVLLGAVLALGLAGCGSVASFGGVGRMRPYGGVKVDAGVVGEIFTGDEPWDFVLLLFCPIDFPLCFVVDTFALPYTLTHWEHDRPQTNQQAVAAVSSSGG